MLVLVVGLVPAVVAIAMFAAEVCRSQDSDYRLVPDYPDTAAQGLLRIAAPPRRRRGGPCVATGPRATGRPPAHNAPRLPVHPRRQPNGTIVITDGYGHNPGSARPVRPPLCQAGCPRRGGPEDAGTAPREWDLSHQGDSRRRRQPLPARVCAIDRTENPLVPQRAQLQSPVRQPGVEPLAHRYLTMSKQRLRVHRRPRYRAAAQHPAQRRRDPSSVASLAASNLLAAGRVLVRSIGSMAWP